jgi:hypothetical protein
MTSVVPNLSTRRSDSGLHLGRASVSRCLGWDRAGHLVLVLDVLEHRHLLIGSPGPVGRGLPPGPTHG